MLIMYKFGAQNEIATLKKKKKPNFKKLSNIKQVHPFH
jgi:hypothetical protein